MTHSAALIVLLLGSMTIATQKEAKAQIQSNALSGTSAASGTFTVWPTIVAGCPIDMYASQSLWNRTIRVHDGEKDREPHPFGQRIALRLRDPRSSHIVRATVRVRGLNGTHRSVPTPANDEQQWNTVRTMQVEFVEEDDGTFTADLWLRGLTAVGSIQLINVSYSDGAVWNVNGPNACRVQPDPFMLITER